MFQDLLNNRFLGNIFIDGKPGNTISEIFEFSKNMMYNG